MGGHNASSLSGQTFGDLTVIKYAGTNDQRRTTWLCRCICGGSATVTAHRLKLGRTKSCGCRTPTQRHQRIAELERVALYALELIRGGFHDEAASELDRVLGNALPLKFR